MVKDAVPGEEVFAADSEAGGDIGADLGVESFEPGSGGVGVIVQAAGVQVVAVEGGVFAVEFFGHDDIWELAQGVCGVKGQVVVAFPRRPGEMGGAGVFKIRGFSNYARH